MKFGNLVEICLCTHLAVKGLNKSQCMDSSPPKKGDHCREVVVSGESNVQEMGMHYMVAHHIVVQHKLNEHCV